MPSIRILDIGPGIRPQTLYGGHITALEPCKEYCDILEEFRPDILVVNEPWEQAFELFSWGEFDYCTILDVIEHLEKDKGKRLLELTLPLAKVVTVYTPYGFVPQEPGADGEDAWGLHGGEWQRHRSGWMPEDFEGWTIRDRGGVGFFATKGE